MISSKPLLVYLSSRWQDAFHSRIPNIFSQGRGKLREHRQVRMTWQHKCSPPPPPPTHTQPTSTLCTRPWCTRRECRRMRDSRGDVRYTEAETKGEVTCVCSWHERHKSGSEECRETGGREKANTGKKGYSGCWMSGWDEKLNGGRETVTSLVTRMIIKLYELGKNIYTAKVFVEAEVSSEDGLRRKKNALRLLHVKKARYMFFFLYHTKTWE